MLKLLACFAVLIAVLSSNLTYAADSPKEWFETYEWDVSSCDVESTAPPKNSNPFFKTTMYNSSDIDNIRPGIWSQKNEGIRIFSSMKAGERKSWAAIQDFITVYVLDSANRRCIGMFRTTFSDEGNVIDIMRGMDGKSTKKSSPSAPKKKTYETSSKSSSKKTGCQWGDCQNGVGESLSKSGVRYVGEFVAGKWHGYGIFIDKDGDVCEGQYKKSASDGPQFCLYKSGTLFFGRNARGVRSGTGFFVESDGTIDRMGHYKRGRLDLETDVNRDLIQADFDDIVYFAPEGLREKYLPKKLLNAKATDY